MSEWKFGSKGGVLNALKAEGVAIPELLVFTFKQWVEGPHKILQLIIDHFGEKKLVVRSSASVEDGGESAMAGVFDSILNVSCEDAQVKVAIESVLSSYQEILQRQDDDDEFIVQEMLEDCVMSGVVMSRPLVDGGPYWVLNYDDKSAATDAVTSGSGINKTVYVLRSATEEHFDNPRLWNIVRVCRRLESLTGDVPIDIEFGVDSSGVVWIFQVRRITTSSKWDLEIGSTVERRIQVLRPFIDSLMVRRSNLFGSKTLLGLMPDWNPAEMIGTTPTPLSCSLYRELITRGVWARARAEMGYLDIGERDLMISLFGRTYIDVRSSFNSFLPNGIWPEVAEKLINAQIQLLSEEPHLHDKVEFDVCFTCYEFDLTARLNHRYAGVLTEPEAEHFSSMLRRLTRDLVEGESLSKAVDQVKLLVQKQSKWTELREVPPYDAVDEIRRLLVECREYGTLPFSVLARHGFIAESLLRSLERIGLLSAERIVELKRSIRTVAGEFQLALSRAGSDSQKKEEFLSRFGHLRPGTYDITSPRVLDRGLELGAGAGLRNDDMTMEFSFTKEERVEIVTLLDEHNFQTNPQDLINYVREAVAGREWAKFVFTKHISRLLELCSGWGKFYSLSREEMAYLGIGDVIDSYFVPGEINTKENLGELISRNRYSREVAAQLRLGYLIRNSRDVFVAPMQRSAPNFVGTGRVEGRIIIVEDNTSVGELDGCIVCIERADPGFDWIFSADIGGLVTKYGGANSHMAIRCAELGVVAAIGCGEQPFNILKNSRSCFIDCEAQLLVGT